MRNAVLFWCLLVISLSLLFRAQWDTDGDPLRTWDSQNMVPLAPAAVFRRWFVRIAPALVLICVICFGLALVFLR